MREKTPGQERRSWMLVGAFVIFIIVFFSLMSCGASKLTEPYKDAPRSNVTDNTPADIITMPDGFSNIATKCYKGMRFSVIYHGDNPYGDISVVPDPKCEGVE